MTGWQVAAVFAGIPILAFSAVAATIMFFSRNAPAPSYAAPADAPEAATQEPPPPAGGSATTTVSEGVETVELEEERP